MQERGRRAVEDKMEDFNENHGTNCLVQFFKARGW